MVAWDKICQLKSHGGLGLRKTDAVNLVFQAKLAWKVLWGFEGLWTSVMKHKYLNSNSFLECKIKSTDSPVWKSVRRSRVLLQKGIRWNVGEGDRILFWWDNWCDHTNLVELLGLDPTSI